MTGCGIPHARGPRAARVFGVGQTLNVPLGRDTHERLRRGWPNSALLPTPATDLIEYVDHAALVQFERTTLKRCVFMAC
jgi:hypothetical protein